MASSNPSTLKDLTPNSRNPRTITDEKLGMLGRSLDEFGELSGIIWNRRSGLLVGGHQRMKRLPASSEIVVEHEYDPPTRTGTVVEGYVVWKDERFRYRAVDWPPEKEQAAVIAANKHGGEFDLPLLNEFLLELDAANFDMDLTGFTAKELEDLLAPIEVLEPQEDEDTEYDPPTDPIAKPGDLFMLGRHRLVCGDSTMVEVLDKLMAGEKAAAVWTDPPYNVNYEGKTKQALKIENDKMGDDTFFDFLYDAYTAMLMHTQAGGAIYVAHADSEGANFRLALKKAGWLLKQCLIWKKNSLVMGRQDYHWIHEPILYGWAPGASHKWYADRKQTTVYECRRPQRNAEHPTMKPVELIEYFLENSTAERDIVLDPFGGSGSTMIACEKTARFARLCELDPKYCDVIINRWCGYTGKDAFLMNKDGSLISWSELAKRSEATRSATGENS